MSHQDRAPAYADAYTQYGVKGMGEAGAIAPPAAIANAVRDALAPLGAEVNETPLTPRRALAAIRQGQARQQQARQQDTADAPRSRCAPSPRSSRPNSGLPEFGTLRWPKSDTSDFG